MNLFGLAFFLTATIILLFILGSFLLKKKTINLIALIILLFCIISVTGSFFVGGWDGMAIGILTGSAFTGLVFGWLFSLIIFALRKY